MAAARLNSNHGVSPGSPLFFGSQLLAAGVATVRWHQILHEVYSPAGRRLLRQAGMRKGMRVADFGCGLGLATRMLAELVGPEGHVTGVDLHGAQLKQAAKWCAREGFNNISFVEESVSHSGLPEGSLDLVYCRLLLLHLPDPAACLREMRRVLRPGGVLVVEDGDLTSAGSVPPSATSAFGDLFDQLGPSRGVNYALAKHLYPLVRSVGFSEVNLEIHQPGIVRGESRYLLKWAIEEAGPGVVAEGIMTAAELADMLEAMQDAAVDPNILILPPRMTQVWARKYSVG